MQMCSTFTSIGISKLWRLSCFRYEIFITFLTFWFSTRGEGDTQFLLCWLFHLPDNVRRTPLEPTGLVSLSSENQLTPSKFKSQLTAFFQNTQESQPIASGLDVIHIPSPFPIRVFIMTSVIVTSSLCVSEHLHLMCAPN